MKAEVIGKISALMTAAFGLIAALAWNDAIKSLFAVGGPLYVLAKYGVWVYAILVTIIAIVITIYIGKLAERAK
jgi:MFS-type transporter involved in bile tolerance (Atg22 family)